MKSTNIDQERIQRIHDAQAKLKLAQQELKDAISDAIPKGTSLDVTRGKGIWEVEMYSVGNDGGINVKDRTGNHFWFYINDVIETY